MILREAVHNDLIHKNPMDGVKCPKYIPKMRRQLYDYERVALGKANLSLKERVFTSLCLYAGLRRGEALALSPKDFDFEKNEIKINKTVIYEKNNRIPEIKNSTKTVSGMRLVPLVEPLRSELIMYLKEKKGYLFSSKNNKLMTKDAYEYMWNQIIDKMNTIIIDLGKEKSKTKITAHYLRHTYATDLYYAGVGPKETQYFMGHESIKTTWAIYTHLDLNNDDAVSKIKTYLRSKNSTSI